MNHSLHKTLRFAQGVISKSYNHCTKEEISAAYEEMFGLTPCGTCSGVDWKMVYNKVVKKYAELNNIQIKMSNAKFIWNPKKPKVFTFVHGRVVDSSCKDQAVLEKLFNDPKKDVVILNPNYKPVEDEPVPPVTTEVKNTAQKKGRNKKSD